VNHGAAPVIPASLDGELNNFATEGWELVTVVSVTPAQRVYGDHRNSQKLHHRNYGSLLISAKKILN
jgi:hypothetical protein